MDKEKTTIKQYAMILGVAFGMLCFGIFIRCHVCYTAIASRFKRKVI
jgi:hypothetical protein